MFEFLFNYPIDTFREARWLFASGWPQVLLWIAVAATALLLIVSIMRSSLSAARRWWLALLQTTFAAVALMLLWQPALTVKTVRQGENTLAVVLDNSRSMQRRDAGSNNNEPRQQVVLAALEQNDLLADLSQLYRTDVLVTGDDAANPTPVVALDDLPIPAESSTILGSLDAVMADARDRSLAAVLLISDGADNHQARDAAWWRRLSSYQVPVYTVGVGPVSIATDVELASVQLPETLPAGSPVSLTAGIRHDGAATVEVRVFDGDALLAVESVQLPDRSGLYMHRTRLLSADNGLMDVRVEVTRNDAVVDEHLANNSQRQLIGVRQQRQRVLYIEGEPRWEYKFIRRAVADSAAIEVVSLLRTSPNKFYRQGVADSDELAEGFPVSRAALYAYDAVIIGSLEAAYLSAEQQQMLRDFVAERGGSLLMLAGKHGLADGGWGRTSVAQALPAELPNSEATTFTRERQQLSPSQLGARTDWLNLQETAIDAFDAAYSPEDMAAAWESLPDVADFQAVGNLKPGATVLLQAGSSNQARPALFWQRYGRGKSYVLATSGTWRWQMGLPFADQRHERFWQGLLGQLVTGVLPRLALKPPQAIVRDQNTVAIALSARDEEYQPSAEVSLRATVTGPDDIDMPLELKPDPSAPGQYVANLDTPLAGDYRLKAELLDGGGEAFANAERWVTVEQSRSEDFSIRRDQALLQRLADETGGQALQLDDLQQLPSLLATSDAVLQREERLPLWNMPAAFLFLLLLKMIEWACRWRWNRL